jgi:hypothetical protein
MMVRLMLMLAALGWLAVWRWASPDIGCLLSAMFLLGIWAALVSSSYEWALLRRLGFIAHYLKSNGTLAGWLAHRTILFLWSAAKNLPVALILFTATLTLSVAEWLVLATDVLLLLLLLAAMDRLFDHEAAAVYARPLARLWAHRINAIMLWTAIVGINFYTSHPDYRGLSWDVAAHTAAVQVECGCDVVATLGRFAAVGQSLAWWAAEYILGDLTDTGERYVAWLTFLAIFGISYLVTWGYSRVLMGILSRPWCIESPSAAQYPVIAEKTS